MLAIAQKAPTSVAIAELIPAGVEVTVTHNSVSVDGNKIEYTASTGYLNLKNDTGKLIAKVFFTYYKKDGVEAGKRPVTFTFNGGPGSSSVWRRSQPPESMPPSDMR